MRNLFWGTVLAVAAATTVEPRANADKIMSPRLSILYSIVYNRDKTVPHLAQILKNDMPDSHFTEEEVREIRDELLMPIKVPQWFHQTVNEFKGRGMVSKLMQRAPADAPDAFGDERLVRYASDVWLKYCVYALEHFESMRPCFQSTAEDGSLEWTLSNWQVHNYLWNETMEEHAALKKMRKRLRLTAPTEAPAEEYDIPAKRVKSYIDIPVVKSNDTPKSVVAKKLLEDRSAGMEDLYVAVVKAFPKSDGFETRDAYQLKNEILSPTTIPDWLFNLMVIFKPQDATHTEFRSAVEINAPRNFRMARLDNIIRLWRSYCFDAEPDIGSSSSGRTYQSNTNDRTYSFSEGVMREYLRDVATQESL